MTRTFRYTLKELDMMAKVSEHGYVRGFAATLHDVITRIGKIEEALAPVYEAVPQSGARVEEEPKCAYCSERATVRCRHSNPPLLMCAEHGIPHQELGCVVPLAPQSNLTPERGHWLPRPQCCKCGSNRTEECSRCGGSYCGSHRYRHTQECWTQQEGAK